VKEEDRNLKGNTNKKEKGEQQREGEYEQKGITKKSKKRREKRKQAGNLAFGERALVRVRRLLCLVANTTRVLCSSWQSTSTKTVERKKHTHTHRNKHNKQNEQTKTKNIQPATKKNQIPDY
jgi:hypothetical protein